MKLYPTCQRLIIASLALLSSACTTLPSFSGDDYVDPLEGARVTENETRYTKALQCLKETTASDAVGRFAVGKVADYTGKEDLTNGKRLTQGAALMVMSGLGKAGVRLVERFDTSVADIELKYADNKLITDQPGGGDYRRIFSGSLPGSDYHVIGGITEVNYNIRSGALESSIKFLANSARYFVMNVALDLRLVNTKTLEVINIQSLNKQIIGTELRGGFFRLFSDGLVDINLSERTQEPIQRAVRMTIEQAIFNMLNESFKLNADNCIEMISAKPQGIDQSYQTEASTDAGVKYDAPIAPTPLPSRPASQTDATYSQPVSAASQTEATYSQPVSAISAPIARDENTTPLQGLFGENHSNEQGAASDRDNKEKMKERLLWGDRPVIR